MNLVETLVYILNRRSIEQLKQIEEDHIKFAANALAILYLEAKILGETHPDDLLARESRGLFTKALAELNWALYDSPASHFISPDDLFVLALNHIGIPPERWLASTPRTREDPQVLTEQDLLALGQEHELIYEYAKTHNLYPHG